MASATLPFYFTVNVAFTVPGPKACDVAVVDAEPVGPVGREGAGVRIARLGDRTVVIDGPERERPDEIHADAEPDGHALPRTQPMPLRRQNASPPPRRRRPTTPNPVQGG
jgi:hypothetical protein